MELDRRFNFHSRNESQIARDLGLEFDSVSANPSVERYTAEVPRLGVWVPWADTDSIGWIRYTLDSQGVPFTYLRDEDIRAGGLRQTVDVILYDNNGKLPANQPR